jgi:hypothetical protein
MVPVTEEERGGGGGGAEPFRGRRGGSVSRGAEGASTGGACRVVATDKGRSRLPALSGGRRQEENGAGGPQRLVGWHG